MTTLKTHWLTRSEAAERSGRKLRTVDRWLAAGLLTRHVTGTGHVQIDADELDALLTPVPADDRAALRSA